MKKHFLIIILLAVLMSMTGAKSFAHDIEVSNSDGVTIYYVWTNNNSELAVSYRGSSSSDYSNEYTGNVVIPKYVKYNGITYPVTSIGRYAFHSCSGLISVIIPNSIKTIGGFSFCCCSSLTSIIIPNGVTSIGDEVFWGCTNLASITIPSSLTVIDDFSFDNCPNLTSVHISDLKTWCKIRFTMYSNPLTTAQHLFLNGTEIEKLEIPNDVEEIGSYAFYGCKSITSVSIPFSVTSIGTRAFRGCSGLTSIVSEIEEPFVIGTDVFGPFYNDKDVYATATLYVPAGKKSAYEAAEGWNKFTNIKEIVDGDVNLDEKVNRNDQNVLVAHIMGEKPEGFYEELADLNGDDDVDAADVVKLVNILNNGGLSMDSQFDFDNVDGNLVVASLTCTLNNKRNEAIQLTMCELYCKGNLASYKTFSDCSLAAGGSKECSFNNLIKHAAGTTDFTVCWHYTVNGESFVYRVH